MTVLEWFLLALTLILFTLHFLKRRQNKEIERQRRMLIYDESDFKFENYGYTEQGEIYIVHALPYFDFRIKRYCQRAKSLLEKKLDLLE